MKVLVGFLFLIPTLAIGIQILLIGPHSIPTYDWYRISIQTALEGLIAGYVCYKVIRIERFLEHIVTAREGFFAMASHDLKSPLSAIAMSADLLLKQDENNPKVLEIIKRQSETMLSLIDDLLISASAHTGNLNLILKNVSVEEVISEILFTMAETIKNKRLNIILNVKESCCYCDQDRFRQIATNLISNSVKYTPAGGCISINAEQQGAEHVLFKIEDTGPGIPKEKIETIFQPFEQLNKAFGGHGLGRKRTAEKFGQIRHQEKVAHFISKSKRAPKHPLHPQQHQHKTEIYLSL